MLADRSQQEPILSRRHIRNLALGSPVLSPSPLVASPRGSNALPTVDSALLGETGPSDPSGDKSPGNWTNIALMGVGVVSVIASYVLSPK